MSDTPSISTLVNLACAEQRAELLKRLADGGTLTEDERSRIADIHRAAANTLEGLASGLQGVGTMMFDAALDGGDVEKTTAANVGQLVAMLGELVDSSFGIYADTKHILSESALNGAKARKLRKVS